MNVIPRPCSGDSSSQSDILTCEVFISEIQRPIETKVVWCGKCLLGCLPWHTRRYSILVPLSASSAKCLSVTFLQEKRGATATYEAKYTTIELCPKFSKYIVTCAIFTAAKGRSVKSRNDKLMARIGPSKTSKQGVSVHKVLIWKFLIWCPQLSGKIDGVVWYHPLSLDTFRRLVITLYFLERKRA
jgi:hypothetical protein